MNSSIRVALNFIKSVINDTSKFIVVGSVNDLVHFNNYGVSPITPNDLDIIISDKEIINKFLKFVRVQGEFELPVYNNFLMHTQFFMFVFGVRVDIFLVSENDFNKIDKVNLDIYDINLQFQSRELCIENHKEYINFFMNYKDSSEFNRFKKHSKRLSFYTMLENNRL